ncbi:MAG: lipase secretion chaperone [Bermanella sp.]
MNKKTFLAMSFATLFFCGLAVFNHFTDSNLPGNQDQVKLEAINQFAKPSPLYPPNAFKEVLQPPAMSETEIAKAAYKKFLVSPPRYLQGTDLRGGFLLDGQGELIITASIKQRFDYFFLMTQHILLAEIINIIHGHLVNELTEPALTTAKSLLADYVNYFNNYNELMKSHSPKDNNNVYELAQEIAHLRIDILGEEVSEIFFGQSQVLQAHNLKRLAIKNQQHQYSSNLELPEKLQKSQQATLSYVTSKQSIKKSLEAGATEQELKSLRTELYGEEAALRLHELDKQREQWNQYLSNYQKLNKMLIQAGITQQQKTAQLNSTFKQEYNLTDTQINRLAAQALITSLNN